MLDKVTVYNTYDNKMFIYFINCMSLVLLAYTSNTNLQ